jgi:tripartite-type tricarboxylate transporter receptor subunit TctC
MALPETAAMYDKMGFVQATSTPEQLAQKIDREIKMWGTLIKRLDIKAE